MTRSLTAGSTVLFIGDSITDCGRDRDDPASLGAGYAALAAGWHAARRPGQRVQFVNRGIGGDRVADLRARWKRDCREDLDPKICAVRRLAYEFGAALVPADGLLAQAVAASDVREWSSDGVNLTPAGHTLLAQAWLAAAKLDTAETVH